MPARRAETLTIAAGPASSAPIEVTIGELAGIGGVLGFLPEDTAPTAEFWARAAHCWGRAIDERIAALERRREVFNACADCGCLAFGDCALVA